MLSDFNEDWLKARTWDLWTQGGTKLVSTLGELRDALGDGEPASDDEVAHFLTLPAALPMPVALRAQANMVVARKTLMRISTKYNHAHDAHGHFAHGPGSATGRTEERAAAHHVATEADAPKPDHTKSTAPAAVTHATAKDDEKALAYLGSASGSANRQKMVSSLTERIMENPERLKTMGIDTGRADYNPQIAHASVQKKVERAADQWAATSSDTSPESLAMQKAVSDEFGLGKPWGEVASGLSAGNKFGGHGDPKEALSKALDLDKKYGAENRALARTMYEHTQDSLSAAGIDSVTLYRGISFREAPGNPPIPKWTQYGYRDNIALHPLSSFSASLRTAATYADVPAGGDMPKNRSSHIIAVQVPRERVFSTAHTGFGFSSEGEFVVLGGKTPGKNLTLGNGSVLTGTGVHLEPPGKGGAKPKPKAPEPKPEPPKIVTKPIVLPPPPKKGVLVGMPAPPKKKPMGYVTAEGVVLGTGTAKPKKTVGMKPSDAIKIYDKNFQPGQMEGTKNAISAIEKTFPGMRFQKPGNSTHPISSTIETVSQGVAGSASTFGDIRNFGPNSPSAIRLYPKAKGAAQSEETIAHELGHHIDYHLLGTTAYSANIYGSEYNKPSPAMSHLMKTIKESPEMVALAKSAAGTGYFSKWAKYAVQPREMFARAFSQHVVTQSGTAEAKKVVQKRAKEASGHWFPSNFAPIAAAFDELAKEQGWK